MELGVERDHGLGPQRVDERVELPLVVDGGRRAHTCPEAVGLPASIHASMPPLTFTAS